MAKPAGVREDHGGHPDIPAGLDLWLEVQPGGDLYLP
jgi:hypothetical protein